MAARRPHAHRASRPVGAQPDRAEFLVEAASGGSCVIRVVTSAYGSGADWENEFFAEMAEGWGEMLDNLVTHLEDAMSR